MKIHLLSQRSEEWFAVRKTVVITASDMGMFLTKNDATSARKAPVAIPGPNAPGK